MKNILFVFFWSLVVRNVFIESFFFLFKVVLLLNVYQVYPEKNFLFHLPTSSTSIKYIWHYFSDEKHTENFYFYFTKCTPVEVSPLLTSWDDAVINIMKFCPQTNLVPFKGKVAIDLYSLLHEQKDSSDLNPQNRIRRHFKRISYVNRTLQTTICHLCWTY